MTVSNRSSSPGSPGSPGAPAPAPTALQRSLREDPMRPRQWLVVAVCVLLNVLDGFDVLVMAFTGRAVSAEWGLTAGGLGLLLSAGLVGMAAGSVLLAPWADRVGRRPLALLGLGVVSAGMLLSAATTSATQLGLCRVLTGIGIGALLTGTNVLAGEYASDRWRGLAVSLNSTGYAVGAVLGGLLAVGLVDTAGWRTVFLVGGLLSLLALPLVLLAVPESVDHLLTRQPARALDRVNVLARRFGRAPLAALPPLADRPGGVRAAQLLTPARRRTTLVLWGAFLLVMAGFYFVTSWTPTLLVDSGLSPTAGLTGGTLLNLGGVFGAALLGAFAVRFALRSVLAAFLLVTAVVLALFIAATSSLPLAFLLGGVAGAVANGCVAGLYALGATSYDTSVRATGVGTAIGVGRVGAILSPVAAGALLDAGWSPQTLYVVVGGLFAATAALLLVALRGPRRVDLAASSGSVGECPPTLPTRS